MAAVSFDGELVIYDDIGFVEVIRVQLTEPGEKVRGERSSSYSKIPFILALDL